MQVMFWEIHDSKLLGAVVKGIRGYRRARRNAMVQVCKRLKASIRVILNSLTRLYQISYLF
jgi:hypothetical protein